MYLGNPAGIWALLGILALIIIYLIRPRPKDMTVPSLMFLMKERGLAKRKSFFEKLLRNLVFLLQLIAISALAFSILQPTITTSYDTTAGNTVIVLDVSASMQANDRFEKAVDTAMGSLKGDVSIILAEDSPLVVLEKGSESKAESILSDIKARETPTNIGDAMLLAKDILGGEEGRVLVLSDFIRTSGPDPNVVRKILESEGAVVDLVNTAGSRRDGNAGIVDMTIEKYNTVAYVKNYDDEERAVTIRAVNDGKEIRKASKTILADSVGTFSFETPAGIIEVEIMDKDDLEVDNKAYISAPDKIQIDVLLFTNDLNTNLKHALESSRNINVKVEGPPVTPDFSDYDVIIFSNVDFDKLLTGTVDDVLAQVEMGKHFIVMAQEDLQKFNFQEALPVFIIELKEKENAKVRSYSETNSDKYSFAEEESIDYGTTLDYFKATAKNDSVVYASAGESPVIASMKHGRGNMVYYGIFDSEASFKSSPHYPVFWNELINSMMGTEDISKFNYKTGKMMSLGSGEEVSTPDGTVRTSTLLMDMTGIYDAGGMKIAANLMDERESDIYRQPEIESASHGSYTAAEVEREKETNLEIPLILIALAAMLAEIGYIKYRGDI
ncbi:MAG: BatA and WFA domain-containing protein [Candidatus Woesearchaeota archaeon]